MPVSVGVAYLDIRPDLTGFSRELRNEVTTDMRRAGQAATRELGESLRSSMRGAVAGVGAAAAGLGIKGILSDSVGLARDLQDVVMRSDVVFGASSARLQGWAESAADNLGLSKRAALDAASSYGALLTQVGLTGDQAVATSQKLVAAGVDLRSSFGGNIDDVLNAIQSAFRGEFDPLQRYIPLINAATVEQQALATTGKKTTAQLTSQEKVLATSTYILNHLGSAAGDFARSQDTLATQQQRLNAQWEDAKTEIGDSLLPAMVTLAEFVSKTLLPAWRSFFLSEDADPHNWGAMVREVIADTLGFVLGAIQQTGRLMANVFEKFPTRFGEGIAAEIRAAVDALDPYRDSLHATTAELQEWAGANRNAQAAAKLMAPATLAANAATSASINPSAQAAKASEDLADARRDLAGANRDVAGAQRDLNRAQREYDDALAAFTALPTDTNADKLQDASDNLADAKDHVADANDRVIDAQDKVNDAEGAMVGKTTSVVGSINNRTEAVKALNAALGGTGQHLGVLNDVGNVLGQATGKVLPPQAPAGLGPTPLPPLGPGTVSPEEFAARTRGWGGNQTTATTATTTNNITVHVTEPMPDPTLVGKAIAWVI